MTTRVGGIALSLGIGLSASACAQPAPFLRQPSALVTPAPTLVSQPPAASATAPGVIRPELPRPYNPRDVQALRARLHEAVGSAVQPDAPAQTAAALSAARAMMERQHTAIDEAQVVLVVDRSPAVQRLWVTVATPGGGLESVGIVKVSTGKPGRKEHFRTPVGVFDQDGAILGYRALGTYNENHIRGVGTQGMRVWDFGWQTTDDWRWHDTTGTIAVRMEMHATDPTALEPRLGRWDSEGCIRIPSRFDSFLDASGLIDAKVVEAARDDRRFAALLPHDAQPSPLAGHFLVVVDTSAPDAPPSDAVRAATLSHTGSQTPEHDDAG